jgi:hypothetical protein
MDSLWWIVSLIFTFLFGLLINLVTTPVQNRFVTPIAYWFAQRSSKRAKEAIANLEGFFQDVQAYRENPTALNRRLLIELVEAFYNFMLYVLVIIVAIVYFLLSHLGKAAVPSDRESFDLSYWLLLFAQVFGGRFIGYAIGSLRFSIDLYKSAVLRFDQFTAKTEKRLTELRKIAGP